MTYFIEKKQLACEDPLPEIHADKFCSNGNLLGSVCEYECEIGFNLEGQPDATVCIQTNYGPRWSNPPPICRPGKQYFVYFKICIAIYKKQT